jgi:hypothetical protein
VLIYNTNNNEITYCNDGNKTFVIDHPTDKDRYLVHGCLEGPENGVYYRGTGEILSSFCSTIIDLPTYVNKIANNFTVQITPICNDNNIPHFGASRVENNKFTVFGTEGEFYWQVHGRRSNLIVEPYKSLMTLKGDGPYKWLEYKY